MLEPTFYQVQSIVHETHDIFTLVLATQEKSPVFFPGQFNMLYQFGIGESAISISSHPKDKHTLTHTIRAVGAVTGSMQKLQPGDEVGLRGPFGTYWPLEKKGCDVLVIAGGIGLAPMRSALFALAENFGAYQKITLLYGTRTIDDIIYKTDLDRWKKQGINVEVTLDFADTRWSGNVGVVTSLIQRHVPNPLNTLVFICGPEIMMQFALNELMRKGVDENNIYLSLERNMQCAVGSPKHVMLAV